MSTETPSFDALFCAQARCPLCHASSQNAPIRFKVLQIRWDIDVIQCPHCSLLYKRHFPTPHLMQLIYSAGYDHFTAASTNAASMSPSSRQSHRVGRLGSTRGRLLDYGCGGGDFVLEARRAGWDAYGCDPYLPSALKEKTSGGDPVFFHFDARDREILSLGKFDAISLWAVAEHLENSVATFENLAQMLERGGKLVFNSPHGSSLIARRHGRHWAMATLVEHLQFHTPASLRYLADHLGLAIEKVRICGSPYPFGKTSTDHQGVPRWLLKEEGMAVSPAMPEQQHRPSTLGNFIRRLIRERIDTSDEKSMITNLLRTAIHMTRIGDHLEVHLRKP